MSVQFTETSDIIYVTDPVKFTRTREINGPWTAKTQFEVNDYIASEQYIREPYNDELYLVKKSRWIKSGGKKYIECDLWHNMSELSQETIERFYIKDTVTNHLTTILANSTDWTAGTCDITATIVLRSDRRTSVLEALNMLAEKAGGELDFDSANRTVDLKEKIGTVTKLQLRYDKNCDYIEKEEDSTDLVTRVFPVGPDNLPINTLQIQACDDATEWTASGTSSVTDVTVKRMEGTGCIDFTHSFAGRCTCDLGVGNEVDLSGFNVLTFWLYNNSDSEVDLDNLFFAIGIGEAAWDDNLYVLSAEPSGTINANSWKKISIDISGLADADKNAIRYVGIDGPGGSFYIDDIRVVGQAYIDSDKINDYKIPKEAVFFHTAEIEVTQKTVNLYPTADAYIAQDNPNTNYGSSVQLKLRDWSSGDYMTFIKWSLSTIPTNATITAATLYLYIEATGFTGSEQADVVNCDADWQENNITWNNAPGADTDIGDIDVNSTGYQTLSITSTVQDWFSGAQDNYGIRANLNIPDVNKIAKIISREGGTQTSPYIQVTYTMADSQSAALEDAAQAWMAERDEPKLKYKIRMADLSRAIVDTWQDDTINLGDTVRVYDKDLGINVDCRVKKITEDLKDPTKTQIELTNRAYDITDKQAEYEKKLKSIMPFENDKRIATADAIQYGTLGGNVN
jgi:hypothetical protein